MQSWLRIQSLIRCGVDHGRGHGCHQVAVSQPSTVDRVCARSSAG
jgi:hypothetical protein